LDKVAITVGIDAFCSQVTLTKLLACAGRARKTEPAKAINGVVTIAR
jgi:hypothetical protein